MKTFKFPSVYRETPIYIPGSFYFNNRHYLIAENALQKPRLASWLYSTSDLVSAYPLFLSYLSSSFSSSITTVTLPLADTLRKDLVSPLEEQGLTVIPQGLAALYHHELDISPDKNLILLIDGGFRTVNIALVERSTKNVLFLKTHYDEIGIRNLLEGEFQPRLETVLPDMTDNPVQLNKAFLEGKIDDGFKTLSLIEEKNLALQSFTSRFLALLETDLRRNSLSFDLALLVGGIGHYLVPENFGSMPVMIPQNSEWSNALGASEITGSSALDLGFGHGKLVIV